MRAIVCAGLCLLACAVLMATATVATGGPPVPYLIIAEETMVINLTTGQVEFTAVGEGSHIGHATNQASGQLYPDGRLVGSGTLTAADGSQIFWTVDGNLNDPNLLITLTGGTGRFENVAGELNACEITDRVETIENGFMTITSHTRRSGWISF